MTSPHHIGPTNAAAGAPLTDNGASQGGSDRFRALCLWDISFCPAVLDSLRRVSDVDIHPPDADFLRRNIGRYDAYLASMLVQFDADVADRADRLRVLATPSTGLDHIDLPALDRRGIELICIKTEYDLLDRFTCTAEMAWALALAAVRKIPHAHNSVMLGHWDRDHFRGRQLSGKTLGVLGVGRLGRMVVPYARAFRMNVLGCDPAPLRSVADLEYVGFDELLERSDIISIHIHLNEQTRGLIDARAFDKMRDGVVIVNTSRGAIIDESALLAALESGKVGAAGLDVIEGEWRDDLHDHPLIRYARDHENLVIVPHLGGSTYESQAMSFRFVADRVAERLEALT